MSRCQHTWYTYIPCAGRMGDQDDSRSVSKFMQITRVSHRQTISTLYLRYVAINVRLKSCPCLYKRDIYNVRTLLGCNVSTSNSKLVVSLLWNPNGYFIFHQIENYYIASPAHGADSVSCRVDSKESTCDLTALLVVCWMVLFVLPLLMKQFCLRSVEAYSYSGSREILHILWIPTFHNRANNSSPLRLVNPIHAFGFLSQIRLSESELCLTLENSELQQLRVGVLSSSLDGYGERKMLWQRFVIDLT